MPIYLYQCPTCEYAKEELEKIEQVINHYCGKCNERMERQIGAPPVHFKGRGFPGNDMRKRK